MHILAVSDIHGAYGLVDRMLMVEEPDVLLIGGDLTTIGTVAEAEQALQAFTLAGPRVYCVAGNMDLPQHDELFARLGVSLNGRGVVQENVGFFGVSAAPVSRLHTPYELPEEELAARAARGFRDVSAARRTVFVPHAPPYGTKLDIIHSGIHVGSTAVRDFIEEQQPSVVVCGHIHEGRGLDYLGESRLVNCGTAAKGYYAMIEIGRKISVTLHQLPLL